MPGEVVAEPLARVPTWFGIGGGADRFARIETASALAVAIESDPELLVLGDGANLLVDDAGVDRLVVSLEGEFKSVALDPATGAVRAGAGVKLPQLINEAVRLGLAGIETLAGIPATIGGAAAMNAGGAFGQFADHIARVHAVDRHGGVIVLERAELAMGYRAGVPRDLIVTAVELQLQPGDPEAVRARQLEIMEYKKRTQPMAADSAGCVFKNPAAPVRGFENSRGRISAGLLIDRAGCKGMRVGGAEVSPRHANFIVTAPGARAGDVVDLMNVVRRRVQDAFGVDLESEVVIWRRSG